MSRGPWQSSSKFEGKPCPKGHTVRYRKDGSCVECRSHKNQSAEQKSQRNWRNKLKTIISDAQRRMESW